jgi:hypothetical protein
MVISRVLFEERRLPHGQSGNVRAIDLQVSCNIVPAGRSSIMGLHFAIFCVLRVENHQHALYDLLR